MKLYRKNSFRYILIINITSNNVTILEENISRKIHESIEIMYENDALSTESSNAYNDAILNIQNHPRDIEKQSIIYENEKYSKIIRSKLSDDIGLSRDKNTYLVINKFKL